MVYIPTFTINLCQMWVNIPYMDPMGICFVWDTIHPFVFYEDHCHIIPTWRLSFEGREWGPRPTRPESREMFRHFGEVSFNPNRKRYVFFWGVFIEKFFHDNPLLRVGGLRLANSASDRTSKTSLGFGETNEKFDWWRSSMSSLTNHDLESRNLGAAGNSL